MAPGPLLRLPPGSPSCLWLGSPSGSPAFSLRGLLRAGECRAGPASSARLVPRSWAGLSGEAPPDQAPLSLLSAPKLYASCDLGRKWLLLHEQVTKDHVFW